MHTVVTTKIPDDVTIINVSTARHERLVRLVEQANCQIGAFYETALIDALERRLGIRPDEPLLL